jgi:hypothetical protein
MKMHEQQNMMVQFESIKQERKNILESVAVVSRKRPRIAEKYNTQQPELQHEYVESNLSEAYEEDRVDNMPEETSGMLLYHEDSDQNERSIAIPDTEILDELVQEEKGDDFLLIKNLEFFKKSVEGPLLVQSSAVGSFESLDETTRSSIELKNLLQANNATKHLAEVTFSWINKYLEENGGPGT